MSKGVLERILATPHLEQVVPQLQPEVLHRVIRHYGLERCADLVAFATPAQLTQVLDLDLWRSAAPGRDEHFDADRFGEWLEVMVEADVSRVTALLAAMDIELVISGFVQHVRVFDGAAVAPYVTLDGDEMLPAGGLGERVRVRADIGGYVVIPKRVQFWDVLTTALTALADAHAGVFNQVMRGCCRLSSSRPEVDELDELLMPDDQAMFDLSLDREARRDPRGYVTPPQAHAFLQASRRMDLRQRAVPPRDPITSAYFRSIEAQTAIDRDHTTPGGEAPTAAVAAIVDLLNEAGVLSRPPRALLEAPRTGAARLTPIQTHLQFARDHDQGQYAMRSSELAYLANVIAAGSTIQSRPVALDEASNAVLAVCNLGLENWPAQWATDARQNLVTVFQVGWTVLHEDVCMYAADKLIAVLASLRSIDEYVQESLDSLRMLLMKHWRAGAPWNAQDALEVIAMLDAPSWAALRSLLDQFPTLHAAAGASLSGSKRHIDASAFEFISDNAQIQTVRDFMELLPAKLQS
jgi:Family of unknown function (DUF6178)